MDPDPGTDEVARETPEDGLGEVASTMVAPVESDSPVEAVPVEAVPVEAVPVTPVPSATVVRSGSGGPVRAAGYLLAAVGGIALTLAVLIGSGSLSIGSPPPSPTPEPTFAMTGATVGVASAPVTIEIWADYQCPYCGVFTHGIEPTLLREYAAGGSAVVRFRDFAFLGQESIDAAVAARCADRQGRFWRYHDLLFASQRGENQGAFNSAALGQLAAFAGLDQAAFSACVADPAVASEVAAETEEGRAVGIASTPTLRFVGPGGTRLLTGISTPDAIAQEIARVVAPPPSASPGASAGASPSPGGSPDAGAPPSGSSTP